MLALLFLTPFVAPPILAWLNRWQVKQADRRAALMGYGATLVQVLYGWQMQHQQILGRETSRKDPTDVEHTVPGGASPNPGKGDPRHSPRSRLEPEREEAAETIVACAEPSVCGHALMSLADRAVLGTAQFS